MHATDVPSPPRRRLALELAVVVIVSLGVLMPGIGNYSLVDPWETHYGEVSREMLADRDWVHTDWNGNPEYEGFRSKPVLQFWAMAASLKTLDVAGDGGYSGELEDAGARTMIAIRLPFILFATLGLVLTWWMLARLVDRKLAWLALLVVGSCPFYCLVARQAMPDMPLVATVMGALALFLMAVEDGERPISVVFRIPLGRGRRFPIDAQHILWLVVGGFAAIQALYYLVYFIASPQLNVRGHLPNPAVFIPLWMALSMWTLTRDGWLLIRVMWFPRILFILVGGIIAGVLGAPIAMRRYDQSLWRHVFDNWLTTWDRHAPDRYALRGVIYLGALALGDKDGWSRSQTIADRIVLVAPIRTMRQVYILGCYFFLGLGVLAKGPPGLGVVGLVGVLHIILLARWRQLYDGFYELKRGILLLVITFLPWHLAMFLKDGPRYLDEYLFTHILNRAAVGVDNSPGTFEMYTSQIGHGMWLWAGLLPAAFVAALLRSSTTTREGRVRFHIALWAIAGTFFFSIVQTKFHHYILPAVPALGMLVAFFLHDVLLKRDRLHPIFAVVGAGIVLLVCRDLMFEPERWIEMFVFRYDRPWPNGEPWVVDPSDGFLALGVAGAIAMLVLATPFRRLGVFLIGAVGLAICVWSLQVYMPLAGKHWGQRDAVHVYYEQRTIYGQRLYYFGNAELADDWADVTDTWSFDTFIPDALQVGQPMTIKIQVNKADDDRIMEAEVALTGEVADVGDHTVTLKLGPGERGKLDALVKKGATGPRGRRPIRLVDADRLIAWQLYWRGETFWSGNEILAWPPDYRTVFLNPNNVDFQKYLNDRTRTPLGRRYFLVTESGRATSVKALIPTPHGKETFEVLDTTSNKFSLVAFTL